MIAADADAAAEEEEEVEEGFTNLRVVVRMWVFRSRVCVKYMSVRSKRSSPDRLAADASADNSDADEGRAGDNEDVDCCASDRAVNATPWRNAGRTAAGITVLLVACIC